MKNDQDDIDHLFKQGLPEKEFPEDDWADMEHRLNRHEFFKFKPNTFHLYYGIGLAILVTAAAIIWWSSLNEPNTPVTPLSVPDSIPVLDSNRDVSRTISKTISGTTVLNKKSNSAANTKPAKAEDTSVKIPQHDTLLHQAIDSVQAETKTIRKKKINHVILQDTIPQNDTVWVQKKRKRNKQ
ncbi:MAG: hypothetical protein MUF42_12995 [Cytophagaceae bacterium]|jgi:hypothetical protein|nr:hypothetical protein [Cytophagaceae bacterium]